MRRLTFAAAVCGTLALAACSDQSPTEPTAPPPEQIITGKCQVARFPLAPVIAQIKVVFKPAQQLEALARAATIKLFWDTCHPEAARRLAISFIEWMNRNFVAGKLRGTSEQVNRLTITILNGVGVTSTLPESAGETGVALYTDNAGALAKTTSGTSLVLLEPQSFNDTDPRLVRITRLFDDFVLQFFEGRQFPPYFDIDVIKLSGPTAPTDKVLKEGEFAIAATCLFDTDDLPDRNGEPQVYPPPSNIRLGHNPVPNAGQPNFEVLDQADLAAAGLDDDLNDAVCARLRPAPRPEGLRIGGFGRGLPGLANAAWTTTRNYLAPAASALFLPEALHAATLALIKLPPPAGRAPSLSPFGVVSLITLSVSSGNNQEGFANQILTAPLVVRVSEGETPIQGAVVTFQVTSGGGSITSSATTDALGQAEANWTLGPTIGSQTATASTAGASPVTFAATATAPPPARIVLQWGTTPLDLDAHLTGPAPAETRFHIFFPLASRGSLVAAPFAALDRDDVDGVGPETITISQLSDGLYRFSVHDFTNRLSATSSALGTQSAATVTLYLAPSPTPQVFTVPNAPGTLWTVFELMVSGATRTVTLVDNPMGFTSDFSGGPFLRFGPSQSAGNDAALIGDATARHPK
jgi:hypothetical protein